MPVGGEVAALMKAARREELDDEASEEVAASELERCREDDGVLSPVALVCEREAAAALFAAATTAAGIDMVDDSELDDFCRSSRAAAAAVGRTFGLLPLCTLPALPAPMDALVEFDPVPLLLLA